MSRILLFVCFAATASAAALCASADPFTYVDHWPSGDGDETATDVIVPDGTTATISTDNDVFRVERLTSISIGAGATVLYNSSSAMTLTAPLSGTGAFIGKDSGLLTISSDNSGLTAPGHFAFTNAQVLVVYENGLGSAATGAAYFYFDSNSLLDFNTYANGVYTNNVKLCVDCVASSGKLRIGMIPRTGRLVQNNSFTHLTGCTGGQKPVYIDGTMEFISGTIEVPIQPGGTSGTRPYLYFGAPAGTQSHLWFSGNLKFVQRYVLFIYSGDIVAHLNGIYNYGADIRYVHMVCETEDALSKVALRPSTDSILDLNGHDQLGMYFQNADAGGEPTADSGKTKFSITSDKPAMLTFAGNATRTNAVAFTGAAGLCHSNSSTLALAYACSTTTNLLDVAKGRVTILRGAAWNSDIRVASGATLELTSVNAVTNGTCSLVVEPGGALLLRNTAVCTVGSANIAGTALSKGAIYTVAQLRDEMHLPVDGDDDAMLTVRGTSGWNGWPDGGGEVSIPADLTVYVSDADVPKVSALSSLTLLTGARVICTNATVPLVLNAAVSGYGVIEALDSAGLVLNGDSSSLRTPGTFYFTNTTVVVSNRYGLGSVDTAMVEFYYGDKNGDALLFRGPGLVVDAPITIHATNGAQRVIGPESANDTLIVSNSFRISKANSNPTVYFRNKVRFAGGIFGTAGATSGGHLYTYRKGDYAEVWFDSGVKPSWYYWFASDILYHLGWDDISSAYLACSYLNGGRMVCERDNVFAKFSTGYASGQDNAAHPPCLDLNGHDQTLNHFLRTYNTASVGIMVTSAAPATLTIKNTNWTDDKDGWCRGNFTGAAAFTYDGAFTNKFTKIFSRTTGALTVKKGAFKFAEGAGWGGTNVFVKAGAKLIFAADSMSCAFGNRALLGHQSWTRLEIENGGTLELAAADKPAVVRSFVYNGAQMPAGTYTSASGVGITGGGALRVRSSTDGEPGSLIIVR